MKILRLIPKNQSRGAEIFTCQLSNHLNDLGNEIRIVSLYGGEAILPFKGEIISLSASSKIKMFDFRAWERLAMIINDFNPDIVQANASDTLKYAVFSKIFFRWKNTLVFRNASEVGKYLRSYPQKKYNSLLYRKVDKVISVSEVSKRDITAIFPFLKEKTEVIPIGLELNKNIKLIKFEPDGGRHIVHVGGFTFEKNHKGLLKIFNQIHNEEPDVHLHLIGDGPLRDSIQEEAHKLELGNNITFHGYVKNPLDYIKSADVLILPSIIEGLPGVILESFFCRTPVVAYDVGGISEIVTEETGMLVDQNDEDKFVKVTLEVLKNPPGMRLENGFELVLNNFMNDQIAKKFLKSYQQLVG